MLFYKEERDRDFFESCLKVREEKFKSKPAPKSRRCYLYSTEEIYKKAIERPAKSFYLSNYRQYLKIYRKAQLSPGLPDTPRGKLYKDIRNEFIKLGRIYPECSLSQIARKMESVPAPRFYICCHTARDIFYKQIKKWKRKIYVREAL